MVKINKVRSLEILDSRGNPTVAVTIELSSGARASALVPSGASTGRHEAWELRDGGKRYSGKGVKKAVKNVNTEISKAIVKKNFSDNIDLDYFLCSLDGTIGKKRLGANAILGVSIAYVRALAHHYRLPLYLLLKKIYNYEKEIQLPRPMMNVLNGGRHADNGLSIQEFMIVPKANFFSKRLQIGAEVYKSLKKELQILGLSTGLGDEGGFAPKLKNNEQALQLLVKAVKRSGYRLGIDVFFALDIAASEFYENNNYIFENKKLSGE